MKPLRVFALTLLVLLPSLFQAQTAKPSPVLTALQAEMARSLEHFKKLPNPPYFLSYEVLEAEIGGATGSFGALVSSSPLNRRRSLGIDLRVGSYALDNTHPNRGAVLNLPDTFTAFSLPIDDDPDAVRALLWYFTDQKYKRAVEQFIAVKTNVQVKAPETDKSGDFSPTKAETYSEPVAAPLKFDRTLWEDRVRRYTAPFQRYGNIYSAQANINVQRHRRWFVSSEGASIETAETSYRLMISAFAKASDGMVYTAPVRILNRSPFAGVSFLQPGGPLVVSTNAPAMLFEDMTLERPTGDVPIPPFSGHPYFDH